MNDVAVSKPVPSSYIEFARRAFSLGVASWWCHEETLTLVGTVDGFARQWFESTRIRETVAAAVLKCRAENKRQIVEVFTGCHLIALPEAASATVAIVLDETAAGHKEFMAIRRAAGLSATDARDGMALFLQRDSFGFDRLAEVLTNYHADLLMTATTEQTLDVFSRRLSQSYEEINLLFRMARFLNCVNEPISIMEMACNQLKEVTPFRWMALWFRNQPHVLTPLAGQLFSSGELPCPAEQFLRLTSDSIEQSETDSWTQVLLPASSAIAAAAGSEVLMEPISHEGRTIGILLAGNKTGADADVSSGEIQLLDAAADFLGLFHENMSRFAEQRAQFLGTLRALTAVVEAKDSYTSGHSERVSLLASRVATAMGLGEKEVEAYRIAGLVHDIGKVGVPESVLLKPGPLTPEEFDLVKKHPEVGYRILKDIPSMSDALPGVLHHHEHWNGKGYPHGLAGEQIPMMARVLSLADTFDAMCSSRSYRAAVPRDRVFDEIRQCAGTQFDPELVKLFVGLNLTELEKIVSQPATRAAA